MAPRRPGAGYPSAQLSGAEFVTVVVLLGAAIVATALFVAWAAERRGMLAPGTSPVPAHPEVTPDA